MKRILVKWTEKRKQINWWISQGNVGDKPWKLKTLTLQSSTQKPVTLPYSLIFPWETFNMITLQTKLVMVTWHLTMKLFHAKCHERATLRKLWCQTGNSSLLPVTRSTVHCWPLFLHVMGEISARFSNFAFVLFCYITNHLMTGPLGNSEFCFPRISMFSQDSRETKLIVPLGTSH